MTRRRWIADEVSGNRAALVGPHAEHLAVVLRARVGQHFDIAAGDVLRSGRITSVTAGRVEFELGEELPAAAIPKITLLLAVFKFDRMEWAIEKCTELGVARIIPVIAGRTEPHLAVASRKRAERWRRISLEASEQSRRVSPPEISDPIKLKDLHAMAADARIVLSERETTLMLSDAVSENAGSVLLAFGPEGGWKEQEIAQFRDAGWTTTSLGPTVLRAETAVIAAVAITAAVVQS